MMRDPALLRLMALVLTLLAVATLAGQVAAQRVTAGAGILTVQNLNARIRAWWVMCGLFAVAVATRGAGTVLLFGITSFLALREFVTLAPTARSDHRALWWAFFVITPLQYALAGIGWYGLFSILIPVYVFLFIPARLAMTGDTEHFLQRAATTQWGLMTCVYCVSHTPALLTLRIPGYEGENAKLVFFFVLIVQLSDVLQYVWGKTCGRHPIAPRISPSKTWEGFLGGVLSATMVGAALWWATPFTPMQAGAMALAIALMGFVGGLTMSAIKRDRGLKDYGSLISGHGGVLDRIDSLAFAAPVFFHLTRYFFAAG